MIIKRLQDQIKSIKNAKKVFDVTDVIYPTLEISQIVTEEYLDVFYFTADFPDEDLLKYPTLLTTMYYIKSQYEITVELDELLESRGFKLNPLDSNNSSNSTVISY